jgi:putative flippase GtrA
VLVSKVVSTFRKLYAEMLKFGVVGAIGVLSDIAASNLLWKFTGLSHTLASIGGTCVATVTAYIGNRYWVFRDRPADARRREMAMFALISLIGLVIENSFVFVGDRVLGFHSIAAANVAKFVFGLPIAGAFRFTTSHLFVFPEAHGEAQDGAGPNEIVLDGTVQAPEAESLSAQSPTRASAP